MTESSVRRINLPFLGSLAIVVGGYLLALVVLRLLLPDTEVAATLSALVIGAGPRVQRELEQRFPRPTRQAISVDGYTIHWWLLLALGIAGLWLAEAARIVIDLRAGPITVVVSSARTALTVLPVAAALVIGLMAGARSDRWPLLVASLAIVVGHLAADATSQQVAAFATGSDPLPASPAVALDAPPIVPAPPVVGPSPGPCACELPPDPRPIYLGTGPLAVLLADELPILMLVGMAALWWGSRMRFAFYLGHLASGLRDADRAALASLVAEAGGMGGTSGESGASSGNEPD